VNPQQFTSVPTLIVTPNNYSPHFTQVVIGYQHVCGYINWAKETDCYGADQYGQAGSDPNNTFYYPGTKTVLVAMGTQLVGANRIAAQGNFTCGDMSNGTVQCFGYSFDGALGNAPSNTTTPWVPQAVGGGMALRGVATGWRHACALDQNNEAWCWGYNYWGMVGNGTWGYSTPTAQKVFGISTGIGTFGATLKFRALAAGNEHTCGIGTDNHIYCWGHNNLRQLGTWLVGGNWVPAPVLAI
jgi:alpha-tubulin suppressor-like RCC1 family protein